uniref:Putative matricellular protein osteonectin/sparc/bm-40 n=1 Tax=Ornithodoros turicata TaxID=34597 RepID=A0A2R5LIA1_9ACAR
MKAYIALCLFAGLLLAAEARSKHHHGKKHVNANSEVEMVAEDEKVKLEEKREEELVLKDPCSKVRCGPGRRCNVNEDRTATCECVTECAPEPDDRRKVCSNHNETWDSDCLLYQMRCMCEDEKEGCKDEKYEHMHVDYYGSCKELPKCEGDELEEFPRRMREWLFNVMQDLARRHMLGEPYKKLEEEAETLQERQWVNAVIWKFCDLDAHPHDRSVSRHELFPLRAPLISMEHCIAPFLDSCDSDSDHIITLKEWGACLGLEEGEIKDRCAEITG